MINTIANRWTETLARTLTIDMGCAAMLAVFPMTGTQVSGICVLNTIPLVELIGTTIGEARQTHAAAVEAVRAATGGHVIWCGSVGDIVRWTETGFARGAPTIPGIDRYDGRSLEIAFQNEFLIARTGGEIPATTPELITVLDNETGEPVTAESLRYEFRVSVPAMPGNPRRRTPARLALVGPDYCGYDVPYARVEERLRTP